MAISCVYSIDCFSQTANVGKSWCFIIHTSRPLADISCFPIVDGRIDYSSGLMIHHCQQLWKKHGWDITIRIHQHSYGKSPKPIPSNWMGHQWRRGLVEICTIAMWILSLDYSSWICYPTTIFPVPYGKLPFNKNEIIQLNNVPVN